MKKMKMKVNIENLMREASSQSHSPGFAIGFRIAQGCLQRIAKRACEIKDEKILEELKTLCLVNRRNKNERNKI